MAVAPIPMDGVARFIADLEEEGHEPTVCGEVVKYYVVPATGARAGQKVFTGVSMNELQGWPMAPPHWGPPPERRHLRPDQHRHAGLPRRVATPLPRHGHLGHEP